MYRPDQTVVATVERVFPFGVFVRLPDGTQAYIRRRELTQTGNLDPQSVISEGAEIKAIVIAPAGPGHLLELSVRRAEPDPWDQFARSYYLRDTITATVKNLSPKGVFVQLMPGVDGFIPLSELAPWAVSAPADLLWVGDRVEAMITYLDKQNRQVRLSIGQEVQHQALVGKVVAILEEKEEAAESLPGEASPEEYTGLEQEEVEEVTAGRVGRILVLDDHDEVRQPLAAWLTRLGLAVDAAGDVDQALRELQNKHYGLALIDLDLSGKDGLDFIRVLRQWAPDTNVAVMSTPEWIAQQSEELAELEVLDAFAKPLKLEEIRECLVLLGQGKRPDTLRLPADTDQKEAQSSFQRLSETMHSGLPLSDRFQAALQELVKFTQAEQGLIFCLAPDSKIISIAAQAGELPLNQKAVYTLHASPVKDVIEERMEIFVSCVSDSAQRRFGKLLALLPFESCLGVPVRAGGEVQHALFLFHRQPDAFARYRLRDARATAVLLSVAVESQALEQRIRAASPLLLSGQLAAGFGHEVYNKMSGLEIQLLNLQADCERLAQELGAGRPAGSSVAELGQGVDQLLNVALDLRGTVELFRELIRAEQEAEVDVNEVVRRAVHLVRPTAQHHYIRLELSLDRHLPPVTGSAARLQQVFSNLMLNAVQHTWQKMSAWPEGRGVLTITTSYEAGYERPVRVRFADNGPGIHYRLWEDIFGLGFSTRPAGTGLGLFISRSLAESMAGQVWVEKSVIPTGTTFLVELPDRKGA